MVETLAIWSVSGLLFIGIGKLVPWRPRDEATSPRQLALDFWIGIAATVATLQLWGLVAPVNRIAVLIAAAAGLGGLFRDKPRDWRSIGEWLAQHIWPLSVIAFGALWFGYWGRLSLRHGDTGLYHMTSVRWAGEYAIVPGLGNLHSRLAFNSSFHLLGALFEAFKPRVETGQLINGLLSVATVAALSPSFAKSESDNARLLGTFDGLLIVALLSTVLTPQYFGLSPDPSISLLGALIASILLRQFIGVADPASRLLLVATLAGLGLTMKLSFALLAVMAPLASFAAASGLPSRVRLLRPVAVLSVLVFPWVLRNAVLSGHLLFPVASTSLPVDWAVPRSITVELSHIIQSWGQRPRRFWGQVGSVDWIPHWLQNLPAAFALIAVTGIVLWVASGISKHSMSPRHRSAMAGMGLIYGATLVFWFIASPNDRFVGATLWILAAAPAAAIVASRTSRQGRIATLLVGLIAFSALMPLQVRRSWGLRHRGFPTTVAIEEMATNSGFLVRTPRRGDQCWDTALPCTPNFRPNLQLRGNDLASGFLLPAAPIYAHLTDLPPRGIESDPELGVALRPRTGWSDYDEPRNARTIQKRARLLVFSARAVTAQLQFDILETNPAAEVMLRVSLNESPPRPIRVSARSSFQIDLDLDADFNFVTLALAGTDQPPAVTVANISLTRSGDRKLEGER